MDISELVEKFTEAFDSLYEMADPISEIKKEIRSQTIVIEEHLYKIIQFPEQEITFNHWCNEILTALTNFVNTRIKPSNKLLSINKIVEIMKTKFVDGEELQKFYGKFLEKYGPGKFSLNEVYNKTIPLFEPLVSYVRNTEKPTIEEIRKIIFS